MYMPNDLYSWKDPFEGTVRMSTESAPRPELDVQIREKDSGFLESVRKLPPHEMREKTLEYLEKENRRGTARVLKLLGLSKFLFTEERNPPLRGVETSKLDELGIPMLVDENGNMTLDARFEFSGAMKVLRYELKQHIGKTAKQAADFIAENSTYSTGEHIVNGIKRLLRIPPKRSEIPIVLTGQELEEIQDLALVKYPTKEYAKDELSKEVERFLMEHPNSIGLKHTAAYCSGLEDSEKILTNTSLSPDQARREVDTLHLYYEGDDYLAELNINLVLVQAYLDSIDKSVEATK